MVVDMVGGSLLLLAFLWLMLETHWLTVRLPYGRKLPEFNISGIVTAAIALVVYVIINELTTKVITDELSDDDQKRIEDTFAKLKRASEEAV